MKHKEIHGAHQEYSGQTNCSTAQAITSTVPSTLQGDLLNKRCIRIDRRSQGRSLNTAWDSRSQFSFWSITGLYLGTSPTGHEP